MPIVLPILCVSFWPFPAQQQLTPKVLDITDTLSELSHLLRRLIGVNIEMELVHDPELGPVKVDEGQLEQVLINLVVNARDAMDGRGVLKIETGNVTTTEEIKRGGDVQPHRGLGDHLHY